MTPRRLAWVGPPPAPDTRTSAITVYPMSSLKRNFAPFGPRLWRAGRSVNIEIPVSTKKSKHGERNGCGFSHSHESLLCFFIARAEDGSLRVAALIVLRVCFRLHCSQSWVCGVPCCTRKLIAGRASGGAVLLCSVLEGQAYHGVLHSDLFRCAARG